MKEYKVPDTIDFYIKSLGRYLQYGIDERLKKHDVTKSQGKILGIIIRANKQGHTITRKFLQEMIGISGPSVTSLLDNLEKKGYIERTENTVDARAISIKATKKGEHLVHEIHGVFEEMESELLVDMTTEEKNTLKKLLKKAYTNVNDKEK